MSSLTNLLEDGADVAAHMMAPNSALDHVLSALIVHVEQIAGKVGHLVDGELPKLEKTLLGFQPPAPTAEQQLIQELQAKVNALSDANTGGAAPAGPSPEDQKLAELEAQAHAQEVAAKEKRIAELEAQLHAAPAADQQQPAAGEQVAPEKPVE